MKLREIRPEDDKAIAKIIRTNLKQHGLDLPGTVYFDKGLDCLSKFYLSTSKRVYNIALDEEDKVIGGVGLAEFQGLDNCAELQKLYLADCAKGHGYGYALIKHIIEQAVNMGYKQLYLETHTNLAAAIHMYKKMGFKKIERLPWCVHSTMNTFYLLQLENGCR